MRHELDDARFAASLCRLLDHASENIDAQVTRKLHEARRRAVARHAELSLATYGLAGIGHGVFRSMHQHYRGILALLALLTGAFGVHIWQENREAEALAEIDMALLSDEVSPSAYLDQGFMAWLDRLSQHEDDSLPE